MNPDWRTGLALEDVFRFSTYPVSDSLRKLKDFPRLLFVMGWGVMLSELPFPFALVSVGSLAVALVLFSGFHLVNACIFGLNRFFWIWMAAYPSIVWFQHRFFNGIW